MFMETFFSLWIFSGLFIALIYVFTAEDGRLITKHPKLAPMIVLSIVFVITIAWPIPLVRATFKYFAEE